MPSTKHETRTAARADLLPSRGRDGGFRRRDLQRLEPAREPPIERWSDDDWEIDLKLPPGQYEYKFVIDGE